MKILRKLICHLPLKASKVISLWQSDIRPYEGSISWSQEDGSVNLLVQALQLIKSLPSKEVISMDGWIKQPQNIVNVVQPNSLSIWLKLIVIFNTFHYYSKGMSADSTICSRRHREGIRRFSHDLLGCFWQIWLHWGQMLGSFRSRKNIWKPWESESKTFLFCIWKRRGLIVWIDKFWPENKSYPSIMGTFLGILIVSS